jgi:predicted enzyme related to lactoylglutathione lyase
MSRIIHFEIPADNPERASEFYTKAFGWQIQKWDGPMDYWLVNTGPATEPGINGGIMTRPHPGAVTCNTIGVVSLDAAITAVEGAGGKLVVPKMPIPGMGWLAYCVDTEGNQFGLMQGDPSAK